jgi:hypothetical protein
MICNDHAKNGKVNFLDKVKIMGILSKSLKLVVVAPTPGVQQQVAQGPCIMGGPDAMANSKGSLLNCGHTSLRCVEGTHI